MKKFLVIMGCLLLIGCGQNKTRGLKMEISLRSSTSDVWRCESNNQEIIKVTEENFIEDKNNNVGGKYQFQFAGVSSGETSITCDFIVDGGSINSVEYHIEVDDNQFIKYLYKSGDTAVDDPVFR